MTSLLTCLLLSAAPHGELLYNGIRLPAVWPPRATEPASRAPAPVPYLVAPPAVIPIDVGRQLFVDDFLLERTDLARTYHHAKRYEGNPVLRPETPLELGDGRRPSATPFQDGVWFDPRDRLFKLWYNAGALTHGSTIALATSTDGLHWTRPSLDVVPGTNAVLPATQPGRRDGTAVWLDHLATDPAQRFKLYAFFRPTPALAGQVYTSPDGIHWSAPVKTSFLSEHGDNSTLHYNPFRRKWVFSLRNYSRWGRIRYYRECDDPLTGCTWQPGEAVYWAGTDDLDRPDPAVGDRPQLYNLDMVGYESLLLGVFAIHRGPANEVCDKLKTPKLTDLELAYSRDGFHWSRPDRTPFLAATRQAGDWDRGYLHANAAVCTVVGDRLYFTYGGWSGGTDMYAGGATGVAFLRRDGFASLDAGAQPGTVTTRPVRFQGRHLFVNLDAPAGELRAEVLDETGAVLSPFTLDNCRPVSGDRTRLAVGWRGAEDLSALRGRAVRFRFTLRRGRFYAFWVSPEPTGASHGYMAAGGPEFSGPTDTVGGPAAP